MNFFFSEHTGKVRCFHISRENPGFLYGSTQLRWPFFTLPFSYQVTTVVEERTEMELEQPSALRGQERHIAGHPPVQGPSCTLNVLPQPRGGSLLCSHSTCGNHPCPEAARGRPQPPWILAILQKAKPLRPCHATLWVGCSFWTRQSVAPNSLKKKASRHGCSELRSWLCPYPPSATVLYFEKLDQLRGMFRTTVEFMMTLWLTC